MICILMLLFLALPVLPASAGGGRLRTPSLHLELARTDAQAAANHTDHELLRRAVQRSLDRAAVVGDDADGRGKAAVEAPLVQGRGEDLVKLGVGTPQHVVSAAIDTATDLVWMQCQPCVSCYRQVDPVFDPKLSSSFAAVPCSSDTCGQLDQHRYAVFSRMQRTNKNRETNKHVLFLQCICTAGAATTKTTTTRASTRTGTAGTR
jgi:hypothetical protein